MEHTNIFWDIFENEINIFGTNCLILEHKWNWNIISFQQFMFHQLISLSKPFKILKQETFQTPESIAALKLV